MKGFDHSTGRRVKDSSEPADDGAAEHDREVVLNAERSVLAACTLDGGSVIEPVREVLAPPDFYLVPHQRMFGSILALHDRGMKPDTLTVAEELRHRDELDLVGGAAGLCAIFDNYAATTSNAVAYARIVKKEAERRRVRDVLRKAEQQVCDPTISLAEIVARVQNGLAASVSEGEADRFAAAAVNAVEFAERQIEKPRSLIGDGLLVTGGFGILYGAPGLGKSWLGIAAARALVRGEPWIGIATDPGGCRVGLLQLELPAWYMQRRLQTIGLGRHERDGNLHIACRPNLRGAVDLFADPAEVGRLRRWIEQARLDVLIIDALSRAHTADENAATEMGTVLARLDALRHDSGCAIFAIHHERKQTQNGEGSDLDALRGSSRLQSDPTALIRVKDVGGIRCITFPKVSFGPAPEDTWFVIGEDGAPCIVDSPSGVADTNRQKVYDALHAAGVPLTRAEVEAATGLKKSAASKHLKALVEDGRVRKDESDAREPRFSPSERPWPSESVPWTMDSDRASTASAAVRGGPMGGVVRPSAASAPYGGGRGPRTPLTDSPPHGADSDVDGVERDITFVAQEDIA